MWGSLQYFSQAKSETDNIKKMEYCEAPYTSLKYVIRYIPFIMCKTLFDYVKDTGCMHIVQHVSTEYLFFPLKQEALNKYCT
jgi:hypothetical protein